MNREEWLLKATEILRTRLFSAVAGKLLPPVKVSVGFPAGSRPTGENLKRGQIWYGSATDDGVPQIFISPQIPGALEVLEVLVHELVHACTQNDGHGREFGALAKRVGLEGPLRATHAGSELRDKLVKLSAFIGPYPHSAVNLADRKKQPTRLLKMICQNGSGYQLRITQKWLSMGAPICPCARCLAFTKASDCRGWMLQEVSDG